MAPRPYTLARRAESSALTHARILDAASALYLERGVAGTTLAAIAARADVSRGTILHHFGGADGLLEAVAEQVLEALELPDERILDGIDDPEARIRTFVDAMVRFFERSTPWWQVFEPVLQRPALQAREAEYWAGLANLQAAALGPALRDDPQAASTVDALLHPGTMGAFLWALEQAGIAADDRRRLFTDVVLGYLDRRPVTAVR
jgi:AcrR family transcriptional regulator